MNFNKCESQKKFQKMSPGQTESSEATYTLINTQQKEDYHICILWLAALWCLSYNAPKLSAVV